MCVCVNFINFTIFSLSFSFLPGPRHIDFHPTLPIVYVLHELSANVSVLALDPASGVLTNLQVWGGHGGVI